MQLWYMGPWKAERFHNIPIKYLIGSERFQEIPIYIIISSLTPTTIKWAVFDSIIQNKSVFIGIK